MTSKPVTTADVQQAVRKAQVRLFIGRAGLLHCPTSESTAYCYLTYADWSLDSALELFRSDAELALENIG